MTRQQLGTAFLCAALLCLGAVPPAAATILDFNNWTLVEDPPHANFSSSVDSITQVTADVTGFAGMPTGIDVGQQSIDGADVASSTSGWAFDPAFNFGVSVGFDLSLVTPSGGFTIGLGIGEDSGGADSAGVVLARSGLLGTLEFAGAGRDGDSLADTTGLGIAAVTSGRFIVNYDAGSGNVILGVSTNGDDIPEGTGTLSGIQNLWENDALLVSLFARGDDGFFPFTGGSATAVFTDFHVLTGQDLVGPFDVAVASAVPEPSTYVLGVIGLLLLVLTGRRRH